MPSRKKAKKATAPRPEQQALPAEDDSKTYTSSYFEESSPLSSSPQPSTPNSPPIGRPDVASCDTASSKQPPSRYNMRYRQARETAANTSATLLQKPQSDITQPADDNGPSIRRSLHLQRKRPEAPKAAALSNAAKAAQTSKLIQVLARNKRLLYRCMGGDRDGDDEDCKEIMRKISAVVNDQRFETWQKVKSWTRQNCRKLRNNARTTTSLSSTRRRTGNAKALKKKKAAASRSRVTFEDLVPVLNTSEMETSKRRFTDSVIEAIGPCRLVRVFRRRLARDELPEDIGPLIFSPFFLRMWERQVRKVTSAVSKSEGDDDEWPEWDEEAALASDRGPSRDATADVLPSIEQDGAHYNARGRSNIQVWIQSKKAWDETKAHEKASESPSSLTSDASPFGDTMSPAANQTQNTGKGSLFCLKRFLCDGDEENNHAMLEKDGGSNINSDTRHNTTKLTPTQETETGGTETKGRRRSHIRCESQTESSRTLRQSSGPTPIALRQTDLPRSPGQRGRPTPIPLPIPVSSVPLPARQTPALPASKPQRQRHKPARPIVSKKAPIQGPSGKKTRPRKTLHFPEIRPDVFYDKTEHAQNVQGKRPQGDNTRDAGEEDKCAAHCGGYGSDDENSLPSLNDWFSRKRPRGRDEGPIESTAADGDGAPQTPGSRGGGGRRSRTRNPPWRISSGKRPRLSPSAGAVDLLPRPGFSFGRDLDRWRHQTSESS